MKAYVGWISSPILRDDAHQPASYLRLGDNSLNIVNGAEDEIGQEDALERLGEERGGKGKGRRRKGKRGMMGST